MTQRTTVGIVAAIALVAGIVASVFIAPPGDITAIGDTTQFLQKYPTPRELEPFSLTSHTGEPFTNENLKNHWTLGFLGYTFCPDICPVTLSALARVYPQLEQMEGTAPIQVLFISVDPNRDTSERLAE